MRKLFRRVRAIPVIEGAHLIAVIARSIADKEVTEAEFETIERAFDAFKVAYRNNLAQEKE